MKPIPVIRGDRYALYHANRRRRVRRWWHALDITDWLRGPARWR